MKLYAPLWGWDFLEHFPLIAPRPQIQIHFYMTSHTNIILCVALFLGLKRHQIHPHKPLRYIM